MENPSKQEIEKELRRVIPLKIEEFAQAKKRRLRGKSKLQRELELEGLDANQRIREIKARIQNLRVNGKSHHQKEMAKLEMELRDLSTRLDPNLRKIEREFIERERTHGNVQGSVLVCPECREQDHGNVMNGEPWCFKCNRPLIAKSKLDKRKKHGRSRMLSKSQVRAEINRTLEPGLNPKEERKNE